MEGVGGRDVCITEQSIVMNKEGTKSLGAEISE